MWQGRVPDSRRLLLIGTGLVPQGIITSPQPISRNASLSWRKQTQTMAQLWLQDVALWGHSGLGNTNDQGRAQTGDTHGQAVETFGDTRGQGTSMTRVMCNEGTQTSWGHTWPGESVLWGHLTGGYIPQKVTSPWEGVPKGRRANPCFLGHTARGHVSQGSEYGQGHSTTEVTHPRGHRLPAPTCTLYLT